MQIQNPCSCRCSVTHVVLWMVWLAVSGAAASAGRVGGDVPDAPTVIAEDHRGRLLFAFAGADGALMVWDGLKPRTLDRGDVGGVAVGPDGSVWYTLGRTVKVRTSLEPGAPSDQIDHFGRPSGGRGVFAGRTGDVWVAGCPRLRDPNGTFRPVPRCAVPAIGVLPAAEDAFGNTWALATANAAGNAAHVLVRSPANRDTWTPLRQNAALGPGRWSALIADDLGYVWVIGELGVRRFDPRHPSNGWKTLPASQLPKATPTALGVSPKGHALVGFANGSIRELDMHADGRAVMTHIHVNGMPNSPVRAVHADRDGTVWVVAGGGVYRTAPKRDWRSLARLPVSNHDVAGVVLDGRLYVAGGITNYGYPPKMAALDGLWAYDHLGRRWTVLPPMSVTRGYCGIAALAGEIWVLGGYTYSADGGDRRKVLDLVEIYDPKIRRWRRGPPLDVPRAELVALTAGERLYVIGGADEKRELTSVLSIAAGEGRWRVEPEAPRAFRQASGCTLDGRIYIGRSRSDEHPQVPGLYVYDPRRRTWWTGAAPMPIGPPNAPLTAAFRGEVWVMGGWGTKHGRAVYRYAPTTDTWQRGPDLPIPLGWGVAADVAGRLVIAGGAYYSREHHGFVFSDRTFVLRDE